MSRRDPHSKRPARPASTPAKRKGIPLTPLAQKMLQDMQLAGLGERTHESYLRAVRKFAQSLRKAPDQASENDLRRYLLFIKNDQHWEANSLKVAYSGLKFFYTHTCPREWPTLQKLRVPKQAKLPTVLTIAEVHQLLAAIRKPALRCFFWTVYSLGLRLQEALHLQVADIDARRMLVHVRRGKGHKDRLVPLPTSTLQLLRLHWATHRHPQWLFPAEGRNHQQTPAAGRPMATNTPQDCIRKVVDELGWGARGVSTHTLRHCYATHLLEAGVNLRQIQKYLGHRSLMTTTIYLHLTTVGEEVAVAKIQILMSQAPPTDPDAPPPAGVPQTPTPPAGPHTPPLAAAAQTEPQGADHV
jgi:integrase/recombinase XerD